MNEEIIVSVKNLNKEYYLYDKNIDQLKELISPQRKKYHKIHYALKNINFDVKRGEHIGIIGTNGSGKSTLLKILTNVVTPTSGEVIVNGKVSALLELGAGFNPEYTGIQNIFLNGTIMGFSREEMEKKLNQIIEFADIGEFIYQPVKTYSSGMFARLAFAVAINVEPDILIVDEALSVGDAFFQNKCYRKFEELKESGVTILFVSHDIESIRQMCSRVLWIEQGIQKMFGERNEVCQAYFNMQMKQQNKISQIHEEESNKKNEYEISYSEKQRKYPELKTKGGDILNESIVIKSCFVQDENGKTTGLLKPDKRYCIEIVIQAQKNLQQIIVGFNLANIKGIDYLAENTYANNDEWISLQAGEVIKISFSFVMPYIKKGKYVLSAAVAEGIQEEHRILTWVHGIQEFDVSWDGYDFSAIRIPYDIAVDREQKVSFY